MQPVECNEPAHEQGAQHGLKISLLGLPNYRPHNDGICVSAVVGLHVCRGAVNAHVLKLFQL